MGLPIGTRVSDDSPQPNPLTAFPRRWLLAVVPAFLASTALIATAAISAETGILATGLIGMAATAVTARQLRRRHSRPSVVMWTWLVALMAAIPLLPPIALSAVAVPLTTAVTIAGLLLRGRDTTLVIAGGLAVLSWQFIWLVVGGATPTELAVGGVLVIGSLSAGLVITRIARDALERGASRYESLFNEVPAGLYRSDPEGRILAANRSLAEMLGFEDVQSLLEVNAKDLYFDPSDRDDAILSIETGEHQDILLRLRRRDGAEIWVRETARTIFDDSGGVIGYEGVMEDVTQTTNAERSAALAEERFTVAFEAAPIGMALVDPRGNLQRVNNAFCELLGRPREDLTGLNWRSFTPPEDEAASAEPVRRLEPGESLEYERRYFHASGEIRWGRVSMSMFEEGKAGERRLVVQLADITAQKELQEHLEQLVRSKDEFVASVSHELRTPLTAVVGLTRELADSRISFSEDEADELIRLVADQSADVAHIVEDLLVAARADLGGLEVTRQDVNLTTEADQALRECHHLRGSKSVTLDRPDRPVIAMADRARLRQIVRNLLTNAFRYGGSQVSLAVSAKNGSAHLSVTDDGSGLSPDEWERIFEPYYRAHSRGTVTGSIGLGLSVSKRLAEAMNGSLSYRFEDGLSVFELALPSAE